MYVCMYVHVCVRFGAISQRKSTQACMHAHMHAYEHFCVRSYHTTCIRAHKHACTHTLLTHQMLIKSRFSQPFAGFRGPGINSGLPVSGYRVSICAGFLGFRGVGTRACGLVWKCSVCVYVCMYVCVYMYVMVPWFWDARVRRGVEMWSM